MEVGQTAHSPGGIFGNVSGLLLDSCNINQVQIWQTASHNSLCCPHHLCQVLSVLCCAAPVPLFHAETQGAFHRGPRKVLGAEEVELLFTILLVSDGPDTHGHH
ncbi:hypothetical protein ILYODFUR_026284 [Ilyodon furcidens]|uniref:Uncharacterized protein n=1 Tax=Ilyodon furcidens TaxID=33524 RepID=A0ABV0TPP5_9TELE